MADKRTTKEPEVIVFQDPSKWKRRKRMSKRTSENDEVSRNVFLLG